MNQSCYGLRGRIGSRGTFAYFSTRQLVAQLQQGAHGSVFDTITRGSFDRIMIAAAPPSLVALFEDLVEPYVQRVLSSLIQSRTLSTLRESLLPKLISGEVRVHDTESMATRFF